MIVVVVQLSHSCVTALYTSCCPTYSSPNVFHAYKANVVVHSKSANFLAKPRCSVMQGLTDYTICIC